MVGGGGDHRALIWGSGVTLIIAASLTDYNKEITGG